MSEKKRKQVSVSMEAKFEALKRLERGESANKIALDLNVGRSTVLGWRSKKTEIESWCMKRVCTESSMARKTMKGGEYEKVSEALYQWFRGQRDKGTPLSGPILQEKALKFYEEFQEGEPGFTASNGWLSRWKQRYGIKQLCICGFYSNVTPIPFSFENPKPRKPGRKLSVEPSTAGPSTLIGQMQPFTFVNVSENEEFPKKVKLEVFEPEDEDLGFSTTSVKVEMKDDDEYDTKSFLPEELHISDVATTDLASNSRLAGDDVNSMFGEYVAESLRALTHQSSRDRLKILIKESIKNVTESDQLLNKS